LRNDCEEPLAVQGEPLTNCVASGTRAIEHDCTAIEPGASGTSRVYFSTRGPQETQIRFAINGEEHVATVESEVHSFDEGCSFSANARGSASGIWLLAAVSLGLLRRRR
jgi:hypothetical protein